LNWKYASRERLRTLAAQMLDRERWPRERLLECQRSRLREIVQRAVANSPYYREVIGDVGAGDIDLQQLQLQGTSCGRPGAPSRPNSIMSARPSKR
jgi:phenylacetate-coenzyme A ligase PaaK-like adenylate-forming protein